MNQGMNHIKRGEKRRNLHFTFCCPRLCQGVCPGYWLAACTPVELELAHLEDGANTRTTEWSTISGTKEDITNIEKKWIRVLAKSDSSFGEKQPSQHECQPEGVDGGLVGVAHWLAEVASADRSS